MVKIFDNTPFPKFRDLIFAHPTMSQGDVSQVFYFYGILRAKFSLFTSLKFTEFNLAGITEKVYYNFIVLNNHYYYSNVHCNTLRKDYFEIIHENFINKKLSIREIDPRENFSP